MVEPLFGQFEKESPTYYVNHVWGNRAVGLKVWPTAKGALRYPEKLLSINSSAIDPVSYRGSYSFIPLLPRIPWPLLTGMEVMETRHLFSFRTHTHPHPIYSFWHAQCRPSYSFKLPRSWLLLLSWFSIRRFSFLFSLLPLFVFRGPFHRSSRLFFSLAIVSFTVFIYVPIPT